MNPNELKYSPFRISLNKCTGNFNALHPKLRVPKETKDVKVFNMITNKDEAKAMTKHFSFIVNANSIVQDLIQDINGIIKHINVNVKIIISMKKVTAWIACICENGNYLKSAVDNSVTKSDEIVIAMNNS